MRLSLVMPVHNEARFLPATLQRLSLLRLPLAWELIIVDDGSTDSGLGGISSTSVPAAERVQVLRHERRRGKGAALRTGLDATDGDLLGVQDADLEYDPADITALLEPLIEGRADAVFGTRTRGGYVAYSRWYALGNRLLGAVAASLYGQHVTDLYTGYKFMTRGAYQRLRLTADGFDIEAEIYGQLMRSGARIVEVPISYSARSRSEGKKLRARDGLAGLRRLIRVRLGR